MLKTVSNESVNDYRVAELFCKDLHLTGSTSQRQVHILLFRQKHFFKCYINATYFDVRQI